MRCDPRDEPGRPRRHGQRPWLLATLALGCVVLAGGCGAADPSAAQEQSFAEDWQPAPVGEGNLRIASFNIRNFPVVPPEFDQGDRSEPISYRLETDQRALLDVLTKLNFDVMAVQEIVDTTAFDGLVAELSLQTERPYATVFAQNESGNPQHVGVVADTAKVRIVQSEEHLEIDVSGKLRPGLSVRLESQRERGVDFGLMVLHLASGSSNKRAELRAQQALLAAQAVAGQIEAWGDQDYLVLGDLNTAREDQEFPGLDAAFSTATELARQAPELSCTSYWIKSSDSPLLRPSWLDHVYRASLDECDPDVPVAVGAHCAERQCEPFESTSAETGSTFYGVSDHCPVYFELQDTDRDQVSPQGAP